MNPSDALLRCFLPAIAAIAAAGCSGGSTGTGGSSSGGPVCAKNTVQLSGMLDGASALGAYSGPGTYFFTNALNSSIPGSLNLQFGTGGMLHLDWMTLAADDQTVPATGQLTMPSEGPHAGQAYCVGAGTVTPRGVSPEPDGTSFVLSTLAVGACPGTAAPGSLQGCAAPSM